MHLTAIVRRYAWAGWRYRWRALIVAWLLCLGGWVGVCLLPNQYESDSRIYADADAVLGALLRGIAIDSSPASQVELLQRTLLSRPNLEKVIARTDLDMRARSVADREALLQSLAKRIKIAAQTKNLFTISYTDTNARLAHDVVQTVLNLFMDAAALTDRQQMQNARTFVEQQIASYEVKLREAEQRRAEFRSHYIGLLPDDITGLTGLEQAHTHLVELRGQLEDAQQRQKLLHEQLAQTPPNLTQAQVLAGGDGRLAEAERALRDLRLRYTDQHPDVIAARNAVEALRGHGGGGMTTVRGPAVANPVYEQFKLRAVDADAQVTSLERQVRDGAAEIDRMEKLAHSAPEIQAQFTNLDRDYTVLRKDYEELLTRRDALQIAGAARNDAERVRLEVVDPPTIPTLPSGPKRQLFAAAVLLLGLAASGGVALLLVQLDTAFYSVQDLRKLGLPVLGAVSPVSPQRVRFHSVIAFAGALMLLLAMFGGVMMDGADLAAHIPSLIARLGA